MASIPEVRICEVTISGAPDEMVARETAELDSAPGMTVGGAVECVSLREKLGLVMKTVEVVSVGWVTKERAVSGSPGETDKVGTKELASNPRRVIHESVVSCWPERTVRVGNILVSPPDLVTSEVGSSETSEETVELETDELASSP